MIQGAFAPEAFFGRCFTTAVSTLALAELQEYTDEGNHKQQPIMVHRAIFGSIERFFGILIENCAGAFPLWLAPVQCRIMPVTDAVQDYAQQVVAQMREAGIRVQLDSGETCFACLQALCMHWRTPMLVSPCWSTGRHRFGAGH